MTFETILYSAAIGAQKNDSKFFGIASEQLGVAMDQRANVLFIDDTIDNVCQAGASGWTAIHADAGLAWIIEAERRLGLR